MTDTTCGIHKTWVLSPAYSEEILKTLVLSLTSMGGKSIGPLKLVVEYLTSGVQNNPLAGPSSPKIVYRVTEKHRPDQVGLVFSTTESGGARGHVLTAKPAIEVALEQSKLFTRQHMVIMGECVRMGDFVIRIGNLSLSTHPKGSTILDIEYSSCTLLGHGLDAIDEVRGRVEIIIDDTLRKFSGVPAPKWEDLSPVPAEYGYYSLGSTMTLSHRFVHYTSMFRKVASSVNS